MGIKWSRLDKDSSRHTESSYTSEESTSYSQGVTPDSVDAASKSVKPSLRLRKLSRRQPLLTLCLRKQTTEEHLPYNRGCSRGDNSCNSNGEFDDCQGNLERGLAKDMTFIGGSTQLKRESSESRYSCQKRKLSSSRRRSHTKGGKGLPGRVTVTSLGERPDQGDKRKTSERRVSFAGITEDVSHPGMRKTSCPEKCKVSATQDSRAACGCKQYTEGQKQRGCARKNPFRRLSSIDVLTATNALPGDPSLRQVKVEIRHQRTSIELTSPACDVFGSAAQIIFVASKPEN